MVSYSLCTCWFLVLTGPSHAAMLSTQSQGSGGSPGRSHQDPMADPAPAGGPGLQAAVQAAVQAAEGDVHTMGGLALH